MNIWRNFKPRPKISLISIDLIVIQTSAVIIDSDDNFPLKLVDLFVSKFMSSNSVCTSSPNVSFVFVSFAEYYKILEIPVMFVDFLQTEANLS